MDEIQLKAKCRDLFQRRCVLCGKRTIIVHEIVPRSNGKVALQLHNMVTICNEHHLWAHNVGSKVSAPILKKAREKRLHAYSSG